MDKSTLYDIPQMSVNEPLKNAMETAHNSTIDSIFQEGSLFRTTGVSNKSAEIITQHVLSSSSSNLPENRQSSAMIMKLETENKLDKSSSSTTALSHETPSYIHTADNQCAENSMFKYDSSISADESSYFSSDLKDLSELFNNFIMTSVSQNGEDTNAFCPHSVDGRKSDYSFIGLDDFQLCGASPSLSSTAEFPSNISAQPRSQSRFSESTYFFNECSNLAGTDCEKYIDAEHTLDTCYSRKQAVDIKAENDANFSSNDRCSFSMDSIEYLSPRIIQDADVSDDHRSDSLKSMSISAVENNNDDASGNRSDEPMAPEFVASHRNGTSQNSFLTDSTPLVQSRALSSPLHNSTGLYRHSRSFSDMPKHTITPTHKLQKSFSFDVPETNGDLLHDHTINMLFHSCSYTRHPDTSNDLITSQSKTSVQVPNSSDEKQCLSESPSPRIKIDDPKMHGRGVDYPFLDTSVDESLIDPIFLSDNISNLLNHHNESSGITKTPIVDAHLNNLNDFDLNLDDIDDDVQSSSCRSSFSQVFDKNSQQKVLVDNFIDKRLSSKKQKEKSQVKPSAIENYDLGNTSDARKKSPIRKNIANGIHKKSTKLRNNSSDAASNGTKKIFGKRNKTSKVLAIDNLSCGGSEKSKSSDKATTRDPEKIFPCGYEGCKRMFKRKEHAKRHFICTHTGLKPFKCDACGRSFPRNDNMIQHWKTHTKYKEKKK